MTPITDSPAMLPAATDISAAFESFEGRSRQKISEITPPTQTESDSEKGLSAAIPMAAAEGMKRPQRPRDKAEKTTPIPNPMAPACSA